MVGVKFIEGDFDTSDWEEIPAEKFLREVYRVDKSAYEKLRRGLNELGSVKLKRKKVGRNWVYFDGKNYVIIEKPQRGDKTRIVLNEVRKLLERKSGGVTVREVYDSLRQKGIAVHRPFVFNVIKKNCEYVYEQTKGGRRYMVIKGVKV